MNKDAIHQKTEDITDVYSYSPPVDHRFQPSNNVPIHLYSLSTLQLHIHLTDLIRKTKKRKKSICMHNSRLSYKYIIKFHGKY